MICPNCGFKLDENMTRCPVCGKRIYNGNNKKVKNTIQFSLKLIVDIILVLISLFIMFFGIVGISEGDLLFGLFIALFGLSFNPFLYKKTSHKFLIFIMPLLLFIATFIIALLTL